MDKTYTDYIQRIILHFSVENKNKDTLLNQYTTQRQIMKIDFKFDEDEPRKIYKLQRKYKSSHLVFYDLERNFKFIWQVAIAVIKILQTITPLYNEYILKGID